MKPEFGTFRQTFSDKKIFDNFSTVKNLGFSTAPITITCSLAMTPKASESNRIRFVISRIAHL